MPPYLTTGIGEDTAVDLVDASGGRDGGRRANPRSVLTPPTGTRDSLGLGGQGSGSALVLSSDYSPPPPALRMGPAGFPGR
jgi:hypothetical protein